MENNNNKTDDLYNRHLEEYKNIKPYKGSVQNYDQWRGLLAEKGAEVSRLYSEEQNRKLMDKVILGDRRLVELEHQKTVLQSTLSSRDEEIKELKGKLESYKPINKLCDCARQYQSSARLHCDGNCRM